MADVRAGKFAPIYLLQGEEPYYIDQLTELLTSSVIKDAEARDFDQYMMFGADTSVRAVMDSARQYPVMGDRTFVALREAQVMPNARNELEKLAPYAKATIHSTVLLIVYKGEPLKATSQLVKEIKKSGGVVFDSPKVREWNLSPLITDYCAARKIPIDRKAVEMLKEYIGADLSRLFSQIDKLVIASPAGTPITPELIERNVGISKDYNNFELINALANRDYVRCMQIVSYFERNPKQNPVVVTVSLLFRFFSNLMLAHYAPDKTERGLMMQLGFRSPYQLKEVNLGLRNYNARAVMNIIHELRLLDCRSKGIGTNQKDYASLKQFIYNAFTS